MKTKINVFLIICLFLSLVFTSCIYKEKTNENDLSIETTQNESALFPEKSTDTPLEKQSYSFDTYSDLVDWLKEEKTVVGEGKLKERSNWGADYVDYVTEVNAHSQNGTPLYIPYFNGVPAELRQAEGFHGISFMTSELYNLPWVWYYVKIGEEEVIVKCACLSQKDFERVAVAKASDAVKNFSRSAPNIDNFTSKSNYTSITERTITFSGESVSALYLEPNNDLRVSLQFVFDKTMVIITASPKMLNGDMIGTLSLEKANMQ